MSLDTRGVQIANGSKNPDDEQLEAMFCQKILINIYRIKPYLFSGNFVQSQLNIIVALTRRQISLCLEIRLDVRL